MKNSSKWLTGTLAALCGVLLVLCIVLAAGWGRAAKNTAVLPEVRNNGTAIQWKYAGEQEWHDLVTLETLKGAAGEKGADGSSGRDGKNGEAGKDGADGKNGKNGKSIEVKRTDSHIQWRYEGGQWQELVALCDITGPSGQQGAPGADGKTPEFRTEGNMLQWRYCGSEIWLNLFDLSVLKGKDGQNGSDGQNGADGNTPFIGENGCWWIGDTDTGIKAAGTDGEKGDKGDKGDRGEKGEKGDAGQNGACAGYFYAEASCVSNVLLSQGSANIRLGEKINSGGLISSYEDKITLKKGHIYSLSISGSLEVASNEFSSSGNYSVQMTDGYDNGFCREATRIKRDGAKIPQTKDQYAFNFTRLYDASAKDITLEFWFEQSAYNTILRGFNGNIVVTALN